MTIPRATASPWPARCAYISAAIFTAASGGTNLIYGWQKGDTLATSIVWSGVAGAVAIVFALSWPAMIVSADRKQWSRAAMALTALLLTGTYSITAALGSALGGRANAALEAQDATDRKARAQAAYEAAKRETETLATAKPASELQTLLTAAQRELTALPPMRSVAELDALLAAARRDPRRYDCAAVNGSLAIACPRLAAERARAAQRSALESKIALLAGEVAAAENVLQEQRARAGEAMERAAGSLAKAGPARLPNSDAAALTSYLQAFGLRVNADRVNKLLALLAVLVIESGGGLALAVAMALGDMRSGHVDGAIVQSKRSLTERQTGTPKASPGRSSEIASLNSAVAGLAALNGRPERSAHERVLSALRARNGVLFGSQVALGAAFGWSKTRLHEVLHELEAAGRVRLSVSRQGTAVRLLAGSV